MSSSGNVDLRMTALEYAAWELEQQERHEFFEGKVVSLAGGTRRHSLIGSNIAGELGRLSKGQPCQVHGCSMRVLIEATGYQAYPDCSVACPADGEDESQEVITNPILLVEVLSPSTADFDRGGKFGHYRQIASLKEYLVFWQDEARVEQHTRTAEGLWLLREVVGLNETLQCESLQQPLALRDVYDKVQFEQTKLD
ncbi:MAG: Uma2 family endonuclease [Pirellulaceae bacterium]